MCKRTRLIDLDRLESTRVIQTYRVVSACGEETVSVLREGEAFDFISLLVVRNDVDDSHGGGVDDKHTAVVRRCKDVGVERAP